MLASHHSKLVLLMSTMHRSAPAAQCSPYALPPASPCLMREDSDASVAACRGGIPKQWCCQVRLQPPLATEPEHALGLSARAGQPPAWAGPFSAASRVRAQGCLKACGDINLQLHCWVGPCLHLLLISHRHWDQKCLGTHHTSNIQAQETISLC